MSITIPKKLQGVILPPVLTTMNAGRMHREGCITLYASFSHENSAYHCRVKIGCAPDFCGGLYVASPQIQRSDNGPYGSTVGALGCSEVSFTELVAALPRIEDIVGGTVTIHEAEIFCRMVLANAVVNYALNDQKFGIFGADHAEGGAEALFETMAALPVCFEWRHARKRDVATNLLIMPAAYSYRGTCSPVVATFNKHSYASGTTDNTVSLFGLTLLSNRSRRQDKSTYQHSKAVKAWHKKTNVNINMQEGVRVDSAIGDLMEAARAASLSTEPNENFSNA